MNSRPPSLLPRDVLFDLLPASFEPWGASSWYPSSPPTEFSIKQIEEELKIRLPPLFIEVAQSCPLYGGWFGSIGEDFRSHNHMLRINHGLREDGLSPRYVLLNHGHDGDCDAWDCDAHPTSADESPILYFNYDCDRHELQGLHVKATSFAEYIDTFVRTAAPRCPVKGLRRRAKRILCEHAPHAWT
jgi:hypothetical protein